MWSKMLDKTKIKKNMVKLLDYSSNSYKPSMNVEINIWRKKTADSWRRLMTTMLAYLWDFRVRDHGLTRVGKFEFQLRRWMGSALVGYHLAAKALLVGLLVDLFVADVVVGSDISVFSAGSFDSMESETRNFVVERKTYKLEPN